MKAGKDLRVGDWVEIRPFEEIRATLDTAGELDNVPFMPEMAPYCGRRQRVAAVMTMICGGGPGMRGVLGEPLILLDDLRCDGAAHGNCSRQCTILWKSAWLRPLGDRRPATDDSRVTVAAGATTSADWPYPTRTRTGAWECQATALPRGTVPVSTSSKALRALGEVQRGEWSLGMMVRVYLETLFHRIGSAARRKRGALAATTKTPVEKLGLRPGEWVQVKSLEEISATLDKNSKNLGLEFSRYMKPFCGKTYRVRARMDNFVNEYTGQMRKLENTVLLDGVVCGGETTSGICRRAEYLYWREIWLRRVDAPVSAGTPGAKTAESSARQEVSPA